MTTDTNAILPPLNEPTDPDAPQNLLPQDPRMVERSTTPTTGLNAPVIVPGVN